jgi:hypothetical protein
MNGVLSKVLVLTKDKRSNKMVGTTLKTKNLFVFEQIFCLAGATGFGPAISALTGPHVSRYTTPPNDQ